MTTNIATIIRYNGPVGEMLVNEVVSEEIKKLNERHRLEMEAKTNELKAAKNHESDFLAIELKRLKAVTSKRVSSFSRIRRRLGVVWAMIWCLGLELGWWKGKTNNDKT